VGQFLNGLAGAIVMNAPSRLSAIWFPPKYRGTATGIGYCGGNIGAALGFVLGPQLIQTEASRVPLLLYVTLGMSCVPMLMAILYVI
jgi:nitrate/nitrite transporter NarK